LTLPATLVDEDAMVEKQRQTEKAVERRASEARRREERRRDDESRDSRKPEGEDTASLASTTTRPPTAGRVSPTAPRTEDTLQGRQ
jgi:hypothetical protein